MLDGEIVQIRRGASERGPKRVDHTRWQAWCGGANGAIGGDDVGRWEESGTHMNGENTKDGLRRKKVGGS